MGHGVVSVLRSASCIVAIIGAFPCSSAAAAGSTYADGIIRGTTTTQQGNVLLPGVTVAIQASGEKVEPVVVVSDGSGRFQSPSLRPGPYVLRATLSGFAEFVTPIVIQTEGEKVDLTIDLTPAGVSETVDVKGAALLAMPTSASAGVRLDAKLIDLAPLQGDTFHALLPVVPGVVRGPDGQINVKGGRPSQTGLQISQAYASDPSTGSFGFDLPVDAVESVEVLTNPYAAEYGRFSSGVTRIETRRGTDTWRLTANSFIPVPCLTLCDGTNWGIRNYDPRIMVGGPLIKERLFLAQSFQLGYHKDRVPGLPRDQDDAVRINFDSYTRVDAGLGQHVLTAAVSAYPRRLDFVNLNTFSPQQVTANYRQRGYFASASDTATLSNALVVESVVAVRRFDVEVFGQGSSAMELWPDGNRGNHFNRQERRTGTQQWTETVTALVHGRGEHLLKAGVDLLRMSYAGQSRSQPVLIRRSDGTVSRRIEFSGPASPEAKATDLSAFAQDTWRLNDRVSAEFGLRLDRDGGIRRTNVAPRAGIVLGVLPDGRLVFRGGGGLFYERTPLNVPAFPSDETRTVTGLAPDGVTEIAPPAKVANTLGALRTPHGVVWNAEINWRLGAHVVARLGHLERYGHDEFILTPVEAATSALLLGSLGRSRYAEHELTVRYAPSDAASVVASYVHSRSEGDLNTYDAFFGNFRNPVVNPNQFGHTTADVPHRLVAYAVIPLWARWSVSPFVEARSGFPYSLINQDQAFVGSRNSQRFPPLVSLDLAITKTVTLRGRSVRLGFRGNHLLNTFEPRDVSANVDSPDFGTFYNSFPRRLAFIVQVLH